MDRIISSRSAIKLFLVMALSLALSCVTAPGIRTSDVAELHYGDREEAVVEKLGDGTEILYFDLDRKQYRYRLYTTQYTNNVYALLFMNGKLVAVHDEKQDFSECLNFEAGISWEHCLSDRLAEMRFHDISLGSHDFSHGINTQQEEQAERDKLRARAVAVAVPLTVVLPGIVPMICFMSCGQCDVGAKGGDYPIPCIDSLENTLSQSVDILQGSVGHESIAQQLAQIQHEKNIYNAGSGENIKDDQAILYYSWGCASYAVYDYYLSIRVGLSDGKLKWAWIRYEGNPKYGNPKYKLTKPKPCNEEPYNAQDVKLYGKLLTLCREADAGHIKARFEIGRIYWRRNCIPDNRSKSYMWYMLAATSGLGGGQYQDEAFQKRAAIEAAYKRDHVLSGEELNKAIQLLSAWAPGQCEHELIPDNSGD